jgi:hypothetical protein
MRLPAAGLAETRILLAGPVVTQFNNVLAPNIANKG